MLQLIERSCRESPDSWVSKFFDSHCTNEKTREGYDQSWLWLRSYLSEIGVSTPVGLTFEHAFDFVAWRRTRGGNKGTVKKSTALRDLKVLRLLMTHAVRTNKAAFNP